MIAQAKGSYIRVSPVKVRQVIDLIRGKAVNISLAILSQTNKGQTDTISKILNSAICNAKQKGLMEDQLYISKIKADQGPSWKRFRPAAFGRATRILKKTTHLLIELDLITK
ncbi:MAG: 50S ribosomal protein L22 [Candidatus Omnitrophica bacterium]|nr:50S ribosomal protein L22 [Candidatus Omnitrophota bacterium]MBU1995945.1 50S ribosomal protein L22 [Candidatus Omnitrophota bacterium]MBU4333189.1 50S ribosomal protein L22 [Candidatus Omnitrophota bacterium]